MSITDNFWELLVPEMRGGLAGFWSIIAEIFISHISYSM
jgi:hypothetical protein